MKKISLAIPLLYALTLPTALDANWFGKYGSRYQAFEACQNWKEKGEKYDVVYRDGWDIVNKQIYSYRLKSSRSCQHETSTKQFLGFELKPSRNYLSSKSWSFELKSDENKLKKHFKY